jgi:hypothetical protein
VSEQQLPEQRVNADGGTPPDDADIHLQHFLVPESIEIPWYKSIGQGIKELINPPKLPPLEVTSKPVAHREFEGPVRRPRNHAGIGSVVIHVVVVALLLFVGSLKPVQKANERVHPFDRT